MPSNKLSLSKHTSFSETLVSEADPNSILVILFIPSKTSDGKELPKGQDQALWAESAGDTLAELFGGSTAMPSAKGKWYNPKSGEIITEDVVMVHCYCKPCEVQDKAKLTKLAKYLHRLGRKTKQGEVAIVIDNVFHKITEFSLPDN